MSILRQIIIAIKNEWPLKLFSILLAVTLWGYVIAQKNPPIQEQKMLAVETAGTPANLIATTIQPSEVEVTFKGRRRTMAAVDLSTVHLIAELSGRSTGEHKVPLEVRGLPENVDATFERRLARITLDVKTSVERQVTVEPIGKQAEGFRLGTPQVTPGKVTIEGASSTVRQVARVVASVDISGSNKTLQKQVGVEPRDEYNVLITGLQTEPSQVSVTVPITKVATKTVPITPQLSDPPAGYKVSSVQTSPSTVTITGQESAVNDVEYIRTVEIGIGDLRGRGTFTPTLVFPEGIESVGVGAATVTVTTQQTALPETSEEPAAEPGEGPTKPKPGLSPDSEETPQPAETGAGPNSSGGDNTAGG